MIEIANYEEYARMKEISKDERQAQTGRLLYIVYVDIQVMLPQSHLPHQLGASG
jgi:hypothetical protein